MQDIKIIPERGCPERKAVQKFAFLPTLVQSSENVWRNIWWKPYYTIFEKRKFNGTEVSAFGDSCYFEREDWIELKNTDDIKFLNDAEARQ